MVNHNAAETVGKELYNESKGMSLGVVKSVTDEHVTTEDVSGKVTVRSRDNVETLLRTSSLAPRDPGIWWDANKADMSLAREGRL